MVKVLSGIANCGDNMSAFITSGSLIFLMGCTYCGHSLQLAVAECLAGLFRQVRATPRPHTRPYTTRPYTTRTPDLSLIPPA